MRARLRETLTLWFLGFSLCVSDESAKLEGDVMIGGLFKIFDPEEGSCSTTVDTASVRDFEAAKWTLNQLNEANYIPGVRIGIEAYSTCNIPGRAVYHTINFVQTALENKRNITSLPITGILGPESSSEAEDTSAFISSLPKENQLYQFLFSATSSSLKDEKFSNIVRVIPNDQLQTKVMQNLLEQLEWNYIAVVYENTTYGRRAFQELTQHVKGAEICIANSFPIQIGNTESVDLVALQSVLDNLLINAESQITGVIFFVSTSTAETFLTVARGRKQSINFRLLMVFSESIALEKSLLAKYDVVSKGSFVTSPAVLKVEQFSSHWKEVLSNKTTFLRETVSNPWLFDVFQKYKSCRPLDGSCLMPTWQDITTTENENIFESYTIIATLLHVKGIKNLHSEECGDAIGICDKFRTLLQKDKSLVLKKIPTNISYEDLPFDFDKNFSVVISGGNEATMKGDIPDYEIYQYRRCLDQPENFCMEKVAEYNDTSLHLYKERLADYSSSNNVELQWPDLYKAQCFPGKKCTSCQLENPENDFLFRNGDLFIVGMAPVNNADLDNPFQCAAIRDSNGWETVQAISYAIDDVNRREDVFPNTTIGYIILNSCNQPVLTTKKFLEIFNNELKYKNDTVIKDLSSRVLAVVAELGSSISQAAAKVLQEFNVVQVAYGSTAAVLSDRSEYKHFLRVSTPDIKQATAMVNIIKMLNSSYIQILYSEGTYGEGGRGEIVRVAKSFKVCVVNEIKVDESKYTKILDNLRRKPFAQIVLMFLKSHVVTDVLNIVTAGMDSNEFMFIASEALGTNVEIIKNNPKLEGSISLSLEIPIDKNKFRRYLNSKSTDRYTTNPWTRSYFENKYKCYLPGSFDKSTNTECANVFERYNITNPDFDIFSSFALNAAEVALKGSYAAFLNICGPNSNTICPEYRKRPKKVWESIREQKLKLNGIQTSVFDENGDGSVGHVIYQIQKSKADPLKLEFYKIGIFRNTVNFSIDEEHLINPFQIFPTKCPNPKECHTCNQFFEENSKSVQANSNGGTSVDVIGLTVAVVVLALILIVFIVVILKKGLLKNKEKNVYESEQYMTADDIPAGGGYLSFMALKMK